MTDTIRVYDEAIPDGWCENLIELFESMSEEHHTLTNRNNCPKFTEMCINRASSTHVSGLVQFVLKVYDKYKADIGLRYIPDFTQLEEFRIKKYKPDGLGACDAPSGRPDQFAKHVDVLDYNSARRYLGFFLYLNEPEQGETVFPNWSQWIKPKCGRMMVFPPTWMFPHEGRPCRKYPKYIVGSYLHYL